MMKLTYPDSNKTIVRDLSKLPMPGIYYSIITDARIENIKPLGSKEESCFVLEYVLVHSQTLERFDFVETYTLTSQSPRSEYLFNYLRENGYDFKSTCDEDIVGTLERVELTWECLGVCVYPIIARREMLFLAQGKDE